MPRRRVDSPEGAPETEEVLDAPTDIAQTFLDTEDAVDGVEDLLKKSALAIPDVAMGAIRQIVLDWEASGAAALFKSDAHLATFYRAGMIGLYVKYLGLITMVLDKLGKTIETEKTGSAQIVALLERLTEQSHIVRNQTAAAVPKLEPQDEAELDARITELRVKLGRGKG